MAELPSGFGPYRILSPLGAGGMGQVYKARDTRLQRFVAIKLLHDEAALDPERQRRFAQEAAAASALNHPNILTVFDVGAEGGVQYLVSELIEGESLRAEMNRGRVPLKRVVEIVHQVAEGLAAAHGAGIVHRDLKPENVMVTPDGRVKIVDFGLAKSTGADAGLVAGPTTTQTAEGLIMGTVPYLSPEQSRGAPADFRSDQFALGVMLYELTTGSHPFRRETPVQTMSAIIADEPPDPAAVSPTLPVVLRWLIRRLLAKNPRDRFAHTGDLAADLRTIRENLSEATTGSGVTVAVAVPRPRWQLRVAIATFVVAAALATALWALPAADAGPRFTKYTPFATDAGYQGNPTWSPDGKAIAYEAEINGVVQIFTRTVGSALRTKVTSSAFDCYSPAWSADGYIYYISRAHDADALWRVSPVGGARPELFLQNVSESSLSPDGKTIFFLREESPQLGFSNTIWFASPPDATPQKYSRGLLTNALGSSGYLRFSPDASKLMIWLGPDSRKSGGFWEIPMPDGDPRPLLPALTGPGLPAATFAWLPDNRHIIVTGATGLTPGSHLFMADTVTSAIAPLTITPGNELAPSVSPNGKTLAFTRAETDFDLVEIPLDGSPMRSFLSTTRDEFDPAVSPVNTQFAFVTNRTGKEQIWLQNEEGYLSQPLVTEDDFDGAGSMAVGSLAFSPDGTRLAFQRASSVANRDRPAGSRLWVTSAAGGKPFAVPGTETFQDAPTWSPKGDWIAYLSGDQGRMVLLKSTLGGRATPVTLLKSGIPPFVTRPQWSPDGEWIVSETDQGLTMIAADGSGETRVVVAEPGWLAYAWDTDGRTIYALRPTEDDHHIMFVAVNAQSGAQRVINANLGAIPQALQPVRGFSRLKGRGFVTSLAKVRSDIYLIEGLELPRTWWRGFWPIGRPDAR